MANINKVKIIHINANSIRSAEKRHFLANFIQKQQPDILLISETKLNNKYQPSFNNYKLFRCDRQYNNGGGTAIIVRDTFSVAQLPSIDIEIENTILKINLHNNDSLICIAGYCKPSKTLIAGDLDKIWALYGNQKLVFGGDLNAKNIKWRNTRNNPSGIILENWMDTNINRAKVMFPPEPTCIRQNTQPSIIDTFITSNLIITDTPKVDVIDFLSDHKAIQIIIKNENDIENEEPVTFWNYQKCNWDELNNYIKNELMQLGTIDNRNLSADEIDKYINFFETTTNNALNIFCPKIKLNRANQIKLSPNSEALIKNKIALRRKLYRLRNSVNYLEHEKTIKNQLRLLKNMITNSIRNDYRQHFITKIKELRSGDKQLFREIQKLSQYKQKEKLPITLINDKNENFCSELEKANEFANHFENVSKKLNTVNNENLFDKRVNEFVKREMDKDTAITNFSNEIRASDPYEKIEKDTQNPSIKFLTKEEIKNIIKKRKNKNSTGHNNIGNRVLKNISIEAILFLTVIINNVINIGYYPKSWKMGIIIPVIKKGKEKNKFESYRPIQLLCNISKILETHISICLVNYSEKFNLIPNTQFAYKKQRSTQHPLMILSHEISNSLMNKTPFFMITLDLEKAFDSLWINGFIWKCLNIFKMSLETVRLLHSFLINRNFAVSINNKISQIKSINIGAPQGSSVSAFSFSLYVSDIPKPDETEQEIIKTLSYADDFAMYISTKNVKLAELQINNYLRKIVTFTDKWKLKLNEQKCEGIAILGKWKDIGKSTRDKVNVLNLKIKNHKLNMVKEIKYLGVIFNSQFHFRTQVENQIKKANAAFQTLNNVFRNKNLDKTVKSLLYKSILRAILTYGFVAWCNINSFNMEKLRKKERIYLRICTGLYRKENTFQYINAKRLYEEAKCPRLDTFVIKNFLKFFENLELSEDDFLKDFCKCENFEIQAESEYKTPAYIYELQKRNILMNDERLLYYNKNKHGEIAYVTSQ